MFALVTYVRWWGRTYRVLYPTLGMSAVVTLHRWWGRTYRDLSLLSVCTSSPSSTAR